MYIKKVLPIVILLLWEVGAVALAVESPPLVPEYSAAIRKFKLPVSWQITLAQFKTKSVATLSESYEEQWTLESTAQGQHFLVTPRGRIDVYVTQSEGRVGKSILVEEVAFAKLLGLQAPPAVTMADPRASERWLTLDLSAAAKGGDNVTLLLSDDAHYDLNIRFLNGQSAFVP